MAIEILVPRLGWTMEEGTFVEWLKQDGDTVLPGELIYRIEGDKALTEVESMDGGILRIPPDSPEPNTVVPVGALLGYLLEPGEQAPFEKGRKGEEEKGRKGEKESAVPAQPLPVSSAPPLPVSSAPPLPRSVTPAPAQRLPLSSAPPLLLSSSPAISPRALRVANELGVDWARIKGSGSTGRIVEADVRAAAQAYIVVGAGLAPAPSAPALSAPALSVPAPSASAPTAPAPSTTTIVANRAPLSHTRRVIAERMGAGVHTAAPVTLSSEVDATELVRLREQLKNDKKAIAIPSYTDLLAKIVANALREHPGLNVRLEGDELVTETAVHIGIAVDTPRGLLVPVLRDAQAKSLLQIAAETQPLIERVRQGKGAADELRGSTFTISNLGMYDIDAFSPIINMPECAVLGMGRITPKQIVTLRPGTIDEVERVAVRRMLVLSLTFDHRLVDGAPAARFLQRVKHLVEQPYLWLVS